MQFPIPGEQASLSHFPCEATRRITSSLPALKRLHFVSLHHESLARDAIVNGLDELSEHGTLPAIKSSLTLVMTWLCNVASATSTFDQVRSAAATGIINAVEEDGDTKVLQNPVLDWPSTDQPLSVIFWHPQVYQLPIAVADPFLGVH